MTGTKVHRTRLVFRSTQISFTFTVKMSPSFTRWNFCARASDFQKQSMWRSRQEFTSLSIPCIPLSRLPLEMTERFSM